MRLFQSAIDAYPASVRPFDLDPHGFPIVAYIDGRGYLRCPPCAELAGDVNGEQEGQHADNSAMEGQKCEGCFESIDVLIASARTASKWDGMGTPPDISLEAVARTL